MLGITPISMATPLFTIGSQQVHADVISGQLFNNLSTTNTSGTTAAAPFLLQGRVGMLILLYQRIVVLMLA